MKSREEFLQNGCFQFMGLDVPARDRWSRIAVVIIGSTLITVPLIPFIGNSSSIFTNWCGTLYLAALVLTNLILTCFGRRIASAHRSSLRISAAAGDQYHGDLLSDAAGDRDVEPTKPRILDLIILVAEVAIGVVLVGAMLNDTHSLPGVDRVVFWDQWEEIISTQLFLIAFTLGFLIHWIGRMRRPFRLFAQSPGAIACLLASAVLLATAYHLAVSYQAEYVRHDMQNVFWSMGYWNALFSSPPIAIGLLILAAWNLLALCGRWKTERTWIDRWGRVLGVCWVGWAVVNTIVLPGASLIQYWGYLF